MKTNRQWIILACFLVPALIGWSEDAVNLKRGYLPIDETIDVSRIQPTVDVNFPRFLLNEVIAGISGDPENPFTKAGINLHDLVSEVSRIRLIVVEGEGTERDTLMAATSKLEKILRSEWVSIVSVPEENVGLYMIGDETGEKMAGLAVLIVQDDTVVIANIEGRVPIGSLIMLAARSDALPEDFLKQLSKFGNGVQPPPEGNDQQEP